MDNLINKSITEENKLQKNLFNLPEYRKTSDMEKFLYGFKELCDKCNMHQIEHLTYIICGHKKNILTQFIFDDGSKIGINRLLKDCGFFK